MIFIVCYCFLIVSNSSALFDSHISNVDRVYAFFSSISYYFWHIVYFSGCLFCSKLGHLAYLSISAIWSHLCTGTLYLLAFYIIFGQLYVFVQLSFISVVIWSKLIIMVFFV